MRVISHSKLVEFWESRAQDAAIARRDLTAWYKLATAGEWAHFAALKQTFGSADQVGNCVVFDVGNNRYRLIGRVFYQTRRSPAGRPVKGLVYVLKVMDHAEYDKGRWTDECGCLEPPPRAKGKGKPKRRK